jgi:hypothetical protein
MYTTIHTDEGPVSMPNSGLLAAAIGPAPDPAPADRGSATPPATPTSTPTVATGNDGVRPA